MSFSNYSTKYVKNVIQKLKYKMSMTCKVKSGRCEVHEFTDHRWSDLSYRDLFHYVLMLDPIQEPSSSGL